MTRCAQGDKGKGKQNKWIEFDAAVAAKLEARWNKPGPKGKKLGQVMTDSERFVDLDRMMQGRKDDTTRVITPYAAEWSRKVDGSVAQVRGVVRITADEIDAKKWRNTATDKDVSTAGI